MHCIRWGHWCRGLLVLPAACCLLTVGTAADPKPGFAPVKPLSAREERATFRLPKGFRIDVVACEPEVVDPVALAFDEDGRVYVAEMRGYPNDGVGTGTISSGKIKLLEDRDGDGYYERATTFADGLRFPTSVLPWRGGLLVAVAPDIAYFEDRDGDGKAERRRTLYTGFHLANIQQLINGLQWGLDNWVYGSAGNNGGTVRSVEKPDQPALTLGNRGVRFHPAVPGSLQPTSGGGQFGLAADDWGRWFTATNSQHLRHIVLPDHYLQRNPSLPVRAVTLDIPDHGAACQVHRISPFEGWRVERTTRRREGSEARRFSPTELVPGGFITSACGPVVYTADLFPEPYRGTTFVCDPANNLVHRDVLEPNGATFVARRAEADGEFLAATDNWFRPVNLVLGPDGALYLLDYYREVIETPLSLPDDIKKQVNLESRGRGRVWRIAPEGSKPGQKPALRKASAEELVRHLAHPNSWWRLTAQRLLIERQDRTAVRPLQELARDASRPQGRAHALWTLHGLKALEDALIEGALTDPTPGVREQALRLAEDRLAASPRLRAAVVACADDPDPRVRFQAAFTLGEADSPEVAAALARVARRDVDDPWTQVAVLSSARHLAPGLLEALARDKDYIRGSRATHVQFLTRLAALVGASAAEADLVSTLNLLAVEGNRPEGWQVAVLEGLGQGMQNSGQPLSQLWEAPPPGLRKAVAQARASFSQAGVAARDAQRAIAERLDAVRLLGYGPYSLAASVLPELLTPANPAEIQLAAVRALALHRPAKVAELLLAQWGSYSPGVRREVLEALFARAERIPYLLTAIEHNQVLAGQLEPARVEQLRRHPKADFRQRVHKVLAGQVTPDRHKVVQEFRSALDLKADPGRGKAVFKKTCATCHRLENEGVEVGPDLLSALRTKTPEGLLIDLLDPSREVDPRYINYVVFTKAGQTLSGMMAADTASSITLRRAEKVEDTVLRNQIEDIQATSKSVMPEGLEMQLSKQDVADVIAYLLAVAAAK